MDKFIFSAVKFVQFFGCQNYYNFGCMQQLSLQISHGTMATFYR